MNIKAKLAFKALKGKNFMTPDILDYGRTKSYFWELSTGRGMTNQPIFGVTVITHTGEQTNLSNCFHSLESAKSHIESLEDEGE